MDGRVVAGAEQEAARHGEAGGSEARVRSWRLVLGQLLIRTNVPEPFAKQNKNMKL